jgi:hypothetical protein
MKASFIYFVSFLVIISLFIGFNHVNFDSNVEAEESIYGVQLLHNGTRIYPVTSDQMNELIRVLKEQNKILTNIGKELKKR